MPRIELTRERLDYARRNGWMVGFAWGGRVVHIWRPIPGWRSTSQCLADILYHSDRVAVVGDRMCKKCSKAIDKWIPEERRGEPS